MVSLPQLGKCRVLLLPVSASQLDLNLAQVIVSWNARVANHQGEHLGQPSAQFSQLQHLVDGHLCLKMNEEPTIAQGRVFQCSVALTVRNCFPMSSQNLLSCSFTHWF